MNKKEAIELIKVEVEDKKRRAGYYLFWCFAYLVVHILATISYFIGSVSIEIFFTSTAIIIFLNIFSSAFLIQRGEDQIINIKLNKMNDDIEKIVRGMKK